MNNSGNKRKKIIVDAMSGDNAPDALIEGAVIGARDYGADLVLVGKEQLIKERLELFKNKHNAQIINVETVNADDIITMEDDPGSVLKAKNGSSMAIAVNLLKESRGDVLISAGNTGALFTASSLILRRIKGIRRAALAAVMPLEKPFLLLDSGANTDVTPEILYQFALMGELYAKYVMKYDNPRVGLLNNGTESTKGTPLQREAYELLKNADFNFIGNVEARQLPLGECDVAVCDGFTGNVAVKLIEGMGIFMNNKLKKLFYANLKTKLAGLMCGKQIKELKSSVDHREFGGAVFLGIAKPVIKAHGSSDAKSISSTIRQAVDYSELNMAELLEEKAALGNVK